MTSSLTENTERLSLHSERIWGLAAAKQAQISSPLLVFVLSKKTTLQRSRSGCKHFSTSPKIDNIQEVPFE